MSSYQMWIAFLLALLLYNSCVVVVYSYPTSSSPHPHQGAHMGREAKSWIPPPPPGCHHHVPQLPPKYRPRKTPPGPPPPPPAAFYFFSPPPPSPLHSPKSPRPVGP
ncbi:hypothetical protein SESBI_50689 [Sesbania bispinosa]|nr:hypothetical protein SESBI_50689 [Sesbania bispinosa]